MNKAFLYEMLRTESVSGGEIPLQKKVAAYMREQGAEVETDLAGDVISSINSASPFRVLLCGHIDEIASCRVTHITDDGYLQVARPAASVWHWLGGKRVTVAGAEAAHRCYGPAAAQRRGAHRHRADRSLHRLWLHQPGGGPGAGRPGDFVTYSYAVDELENDCIAGRGWTTAWAPIPCSTLCCGPGRRGAKVGVFAATTTGEETTMRGAFHAAGRVRPTLAVAVDVIHTSDFSGMPPQRFGRIKLGGGPPWPRARCAARLSTGRWRRPPGGWESPCSMPSPQALWAPMRISSTRRVRACP